MSKKDKEKAKKKRKTKRRKRFWPKSKLPKTANQSVAENTRKAKTNVAAVVLCLI